MRTAALLLAALAPGCAPSSTDIQADFDAHVARSSACTVDADCVPAGVPYCHAAGTCQVDPAL